jgi:hypothetical protein
MFILGATLRWVISRRVSDSYNHPTGVAQAPSKLVLPACRKKPAQGQVEPFFPGPKVLGHAEHSLEVVSTRKSF